MPNMLENSKFVTGDPFHLDDISFRARYSSPVSLYRDTSKKSYKTYFLEDKKLNYLVSNEFIIPRVFGAWSEKAMETISDNEGVVLAVAGGMDSAFDFFVNSSRDVLSDADVMGDSVVDNRQLVFLNISPAQIGVVVPWKLALVANNPSWRGYLVDQIPLKQIFRDYLKTGDNKLSLKEGLYFLYDAFDRNEVEPEDLDEFIDRVEELVSLDNSIKELLKQKLPKSPQLQMKSSGRGLINAIEGTIDIWIVKACLSQKSVWFRPYGYAMVRQAMLEHRIKRAVLPVQEIHQSSLVSVIRNQKIAGLHFTNALQYGTKKSANQMFLGYETDEYDMSDALICYFAWDQYAYECATQVIHFSEWRDHLDVMTQKMWQT